MIRAAIFFGDLPRNSNRQVEHGIFVFLKQLHLTVTLLVIPSAQIGRRTGATDFRNRAAGLVPRSKLGS